MTMMDHLITISSQLSSVSSTSSLPSLASQSIADSDAPSEPSPSALQPQEKPTTSNNAETMTAIRGTLSTSRPERLTPFQSFRSLTPSGPFHPLSRGSGGGQFHCIISAISFACLCSLHTITAAAAAEGDRPNQRQLEDEWTGEWNGEWTATNDDDAVYECGDNCDDDNQKSNSEGSSMWLDNDIDALGFSPDQIITYVSIGILAFMTLLCCMCYPEIIVVTYGKMCGCCGGGGGAGGKGVGSGNGEEEAVVEDSYVGGRQEREDKDRKKKKRRKSKTRSSSRSKREPRGDVELV